MRKAIASAVLGVLVSLGALAGAQDSRPTSRPAKPQFPPLGAPAGVYGAGVSAGEAHGLKAAVDKVDALHGRPIRVAAGIGDVCRKKGCWMVLSEGGLDVRVRFKDYAFFVPRDAHGREVLVEGVITKKEISEEEARHYAEESGDPEAAKKIKGPQKVFAFTATGAEILGGRALPPVAQAKDQAKLDALKGKLAGAKAVGKGKAKAADLEGALKLLRTVKGPRTVEFNLCAEVDGWLVFSRASGKPFAGGYAVRKGTGEVHGF
jgi:hypothetical protein